MPAPGRKSTPASYYALTVPGLEDIAAAELRRAGATITETVTRVDKRDGFVLFRARELAPIMRCGTIEDVFQVVLDAPTPAGRAAPKRLASALDRTTIEGALVAHNALRPGKRGRSYRVVARMAGRHAFRREEVEAAFDRALGAMLARWVPARENPALELWVHVIGERTIAGLRLSDDTLAQRRWKRAHLPASLKPTVARALVLLAAPRSGEAVVDPMCGAGTIPREAAEAARSLRLLGGDTDPEALAAARVNAGKQAVLARWDATRLPLRPASVDVLITNPPYGRQHEAVPGLPKLYRGLLRESARVLRPGGRAVILTGQPRELAEALPKALRVRGRHRLLLRGLPVTAFVIVCE
jgi:23S rRNA G2445 N2-methylase RlmL